LRLRDGSALPERRFLLRAFGGSASPAPADSCLRQKLPRGNRNAAGGRGPIGLRPNRRFLVSKVARGTAQAATCHPATARPVLGFCWFPSSRSWSQSHPIGLNASF